MDNELTYLGLILGAVILGSGHSAAPDHWMPFAAIARAQNWSRGKTAWVSAFAGFGHVTVSAALGLIALVAGKEALVRFGDRFETLAPVLLIGFGLLYALYGWHKRGHHHHTTTGQPFPHSHPHEHSHSDGRQHHDHKDPTPLTMFALFSLDPCMAVVPVIMMAAPYHWVQILFLVLAYEIATIATIVVLSTLAYSGVSLFRWKALETHGMFIAGLFIVAVGVAVQILGI